jgi:hypothetical protein
MRALLIHANSRRGGWRLRPCGTNHPWGWVNPASIGLLLLPVQQTSAGAVEPQVRFTGMGHGC